MLFAESDSFWKSPSVYDVAGLIGVFLGVGSIWYAWYLASRQLRADLRKATEEAIERVNQLTLGGDLGEGVRYLRDADKAISDRDWSRGILRLDDASTMISRLSGNAILKDTLDFQEIGANLRVMIERLREHLRSPNRRSHIPQVDFRMLGKLVNAFEAIKGQLSSGNMSALIKDKNNG